jgi:hypothetical protein
MKMIATYANTGRVSMNHVLAIFLQHGLIIYLKSEKALGEAAQALAHEESETPEAEKRTD